MSLRFQEDHTARERKSPKSSLSSWAMNVSREIFFILKKDDEERRKWGMHLYGIDTKDSALYDIVLHIDNLGVDDAVEILADIAKRSCFQTTRESHLMIDDYYLTAKAQEMLFDRFP